jgi:hypothetical protein
MKGRLVYGLGFEKEGGRGPLRLMVRVYEAIRIIMRVEE